MEKLSIGYVPLDDAVLWDKNPKRHNIPAIIESIEQHGFRDPPEFDATLGAIVAGNGRATALKAMRDRGDDPPKYCFTLNDVWHIPMVFGGDSESKRMAERYAIDHNLLTLGTPLVTVEDVEKMYRPADLAETFNEDSDDLPITLSQEVMEAMYLKEESEVRLENFDDSLAEGFADTKQFGIRVQLIVDLTEEQAASQGLRDGLKELGETYGLNYRIKSRK